MKHSFFAILIVACISGCASSQNSSEQPDSPQMASVPDWALCHFYSQTYDDMYPDANSDPLVDSLVSQLVIEDMKQVHDQISNDETDAKLVASFRLKATQDARIKKADNAKGDDIEDKAYNYCMANYQGPKQEKVYDQVLIFNSDAGSFYSNTFEWHPSGVDCFELTLITPHFGTEWLPRLYLSYQNSLSENWGQIYLQPPTDDLQLSLSYRDNELDKEEQLITGVYYEQPVKVKITYPTEDSLLIESGNNSFTKELGFVPDSLKIGASSAEASIVFLNSNQCSEDRVETY